MALYFNTSNMIYRPIRQSFSSGANGFCIFSNLQAYYAWSNGFGSNVDTSYSIAVSVPILANSIITKVSVIIKTYATISRNALITQSCLIDEEVVPILNESLRLGFGYENYNHYDTDPSGFIGVKNELNAVNQGNIITVSNTDNYFIANNAVSCDIIPTINIGNVSNAYYTLYYETIQKSILDTKYMAEDFCDRHHLDRTNLRFSTGGQITMHRDLNIIVSGEINSITSNTTIEEN